MKIAHLSTSDGLGGAARAAWRLHTALRAAEIDSVMYVNRKITTDHSVVGPQSKAGRAVSLIRPTIGQWFMKPQRKVGSSYHSPNILSSGAAERAIKEHADIINLHWICSEYMSIEEIGRISAPRVWTIHDMWPFCGAEHLAPDSQFARWRTGYLAENREITSSGLDIDRWVWRRKKHAWTRMFPIISPSTWLANCAVQSELFRRWPVYTIPNPLNTSIFRPVDQNFARNVLGLPPGKHLVLFAAYGGIGQAHKGWGELLAALEIVKSDGEEDLSLVVMGATEPVNQVDIGIPIYWLGHLHDEQSLMLTYNAVDVAVIPSKQENLPQVGTEAQACGCPVVAFNCSGLPDVVEHQVSGYLATAFDVADLAQGIQWVLKDPERWRRLGTSARFRAISMWSHEVVVKRYADVYAHALELERLTAKRAT